jgi:Kef-type K+ transport system membrane component KefB/mannitol/fructose-specific phosphotransferase system IIA component (Ntr-type)
VTNHDVLLFLLAFSALLGGARLLGELARGLGVPVVAGELAAGLLLGPTVLGRAAPRLERWLFAPGPALAMVGGYTALALVLLLVVVGMGVDFTVLRRRGRSALATGLLGALLPAACGVGLGSALPGTDLVDPARRTTVALLLGAAFSISAMPVIAKTLRDLGLFKSDVGLLAMAAAMIDDLAGWLTLPLLVGPLSSAQLGGLGLARTAGLAVFLGVGTLLVGRTTLDRVRGSIDRGSAAAPGRVLSIVLLFALGTACASQAAGLHPVFGAFVAGLAVGQHARGSARTRAVVEDLVAQVFAPVFFAALALRVDFATSFDLRLTLLVLFAASLPKIVSSTLGARLGGGRGSGLPWREAAAVGVGMNARGSMGVILAGVAYDAGLVKDRLFVALVLMALTTSLSSGPTMRWLLYRDEPEEDVVTLLRRGAFVSELHGRSPSEVIGELVRALGSLLVGKKRTARDAVIERELVAPTGLGDEVAIPHAAVEGLERPLLALGRAPGGVDFDAPDGQPAHFVFLLLIPPKAYDEEVRILASIARATFDLQARRELAAASGLEEVVTVLAQSAKRTRESQRPARERRERRLG